MFFCGGNLKVFLHLPALTIPLINIQNLQALLLPDPYLELNGLNGARIESKPMLARIPPLSR